MKVKLKLDENLSAKLQPELVALGYDTDTVFDEDLQGADDDQVAAGAKAAQRMLLTNDLDLGDLRRFPPGSHPGIVVFRAHTSDALTIFDLVLKFVRKNRLEAFTGAITIVEPNRVRVRSLSI